MGGQRRYCQWFGSDILGAVSGLPTTAAPLASATTSPRRVGGRNGKLVDHLSATCDAVHQALFADRAAQGLCGCRSCTGAGYYSNPPLPPPRNRLASSSYRRVRRRDQRRAGHFVSRDAQIIPHYFRHRRTTVIWPPFFSTHLANCCGLFPSAQVRIGATSTISPLSEMTPAHK